MYICTSSVSKLTIKWTIVSNKCVDGVRTSVTEIHREAAVYANFVCLFDREWGSTAVYTVSSHLLSSKWHTAMFTLNTHNISTWLSLSLKCEGWSKTPTRDTFVVWRHWFVFHKFFLNDRRVICSIHNKYSSLLRWHHVLFNLSRFATETLVSFVLLWARCSIFAARWLIHLGTRCSLFRSTGFMVFVKVF